MAASCTIAERYVVHVKIRCKAPVRSWRFADRAAAERCRDYWSRFGKAWVLPRAAAPAPVALDWSCVEDGDPAVRLEAGAWRLKLVPGGWLLYHRVPAHGGRLWQLARTQPFPTPSEASAFITTLPAGGTAA